MPMRPASSTCSVLMKPCPSSPSSWSAGTRQSSKMTSLVSLARIPSLFSFLPAVIPGVPCSTTNAEMPRCPLARSVTAMTTITPPMPAVRDERLRAVDHPAVALAHGRRPHRGRVAAGARFRQPPGAEHLAPGERREIPPLLRVAAEHREVRRAEAVVRRHRQRDRRIDARELFDADAVVDGRHPGAAVLLGELDAHQAERGELRQQIHRKLLRLVPLHHVRPHLGFRELAHRAAQELLLLGEAKVHVEIECIMASFGRLVARARPVVLRPPTYADAHDQARATWLPSAAATAFCCPSSGIRRRHRISRHESRRQSIA